MTPRPTRILALLLLTSLLLAGCLQALQDANPLAEEPEPTAWDLTLEGCHHGIARVPVDTAPVIRELPAGFTPVDSASTFDRREESGRTNLTLETLTCQTGTLAGEPIQLPRIAWVSVPVLDPNLTTGRQDRTLYAWTLHGDDAHLLQTLREVGHEANRSRIFTEVNSTPLGTAGTLLVQDDTATSYTVRLSTGPGPNTGAATDSIRLFHKGTRGLLVTDLSATGERGLEGPGSLEANPGSRVARLMDTEREPAYVQLGEGVTLEGTMRLVGGAGAASADADS